MNLSFIIAALFLFQTPTPQTQPAKGAIEGSIQRSDSGDPIVGVQVSLNFLPGTNVGTNSPLPAPVATDKDGRFSFKDLGPGVYVILPSATGYVRQESGFQPLFLTDGQVVKNHSIRMAPTGIVSGRILNDSGQPAAGVIVQLLKPVYNTLGKALRGSVTANGAVKNATDDRGEFRLFGIPPGEYYLVAGNDSVSQPAGTRGFPGARGQTPSGKSSTSTFYPGVPEISSASMIRIKAGDEVRANMTLKRGQEYVLRGRVVDSITGKAPPVVSIALVYRDLTGGSGSINKGEENYNPTTGDFVISNVAPGSWFVRVDAPEPNSTTGAASGRVQTFSRSNPQSQVQTNRPMGQTLVSVTNADVEGILVTIAKGAAVPGRFSLDGGPAVSNPPNLNRVRIQLQPMENGRLAQPLDLVPAQQPPNADGTFQVEDVRAGDFMFSAEALPPGYYIKSVRYGGSDVWTKPFRFSGTTSDTIEVVLRQGVASLTGMVMDAKSQPVAGVEAILVPEETLRYRRELYKTVFTDAKGQFTIAGISPGNYKLFSWEDLEPNGYYDPDFMRPYESKGRTVRLDESSHMTSDVRIIPAVK